MVRSTPDVLTCWGINGLSDLTIRALQGQLQTQVPARVQDPVVTGGCHVKHQPALLCCPDHPRVQQKQVRLPGRGDDQKFSQG